MKITAVLVDDEKPALRELEFLLRRYEDVSVVGMYTNPQTALAKIELLRPHVVFLDINMPWLHGIDAASRILDRCPDTDIVFVTAFDRYAIEAFELDALDYLLKPIDAERLAKTVERLLRSGEPQEETEHRKLRIRCFGRFCLNWEGREPIRWRAEKTKEIFLFLLQNHHRSISKDDLLDWLWPEDNPDKALRQLYNGVYYIRKALIRYGVDRSQIAVDEDYSLKLGPVDWDVERFCRLHDQHQKRPGDLSALEEMAALYTGDYLEGELYPWAEIERASLSVVYEKSVVALAREYMGKRERDKAETVLLEAFRRDPCLEAVSELLVMLYLETGNKTRALRHYEAYAERLKREMDLVPGKALRDIVKSL